MKRKNGAGANLFFIEFTIVLFFFLILSTICIRVFVYAHQVTQHAEAISHAQTLAASISEAVEGSDGSARSLLSFFPEAQISGDELTLSFDRDFVSCDSEDAYYTLTAALQQENHTKSAYIAVTDDDQELIYELSVSFHQPLTCEEVFS
jgi:hypothetical protein